MTSPGDWDEAPERCDAKLEDNACCGGRCVLEDGHNGRHRCDCDTEWGSMIEFTDDIFGGKRGLADPS